MNVSLVALRCRTSDRTPAAARGVEELAPLMGEHLGVQPRVIGESSQPRQDNYDEVLRDGRGCLLEAGGQVEDALGGGNLPVLLAGGGFRHGQYLAYDPQHNAPLCNLYVAMLRQQGLDVSAFASSKATSLPGFPAA